MLEQCCLPPSKIYTEKLAQSENQIGGSVCLRGVRGLYITCYDPSSPRSPGAPAQALLRTAPSGASCPWRCCASPAVTWRAPWTSCSQAAFHCDRARTSPSRHLTAVSCITSLNCCRLPDEQHRGILAKQHGQLAATISPHRSALQGEHLRGTPGSLSTSAPPSP